MIFLYVRCNDIEPDADGNSLQVSECYSSKFEALILKSQKFVYLDNAYDNA